MSARARLATDYRKAWSPALACALVGALAAPAFAVADPTVQVDKPCYVPGQEQHITGSGYTPNGEVTISYNEHGQHGSDFKSASVSADGAGNIDGLFETPDLASSDDTRETVDLAASDNVPPSPNPPPFGSTELTCTRS